MPEGITDILNASNNMLSLYEVLKITTKDIPASLFIKNNPASKYLLNYEGREITAYQKDKELWVIAEKEKLNETVVGPNVHAMKKTSLPKKIFKL